MSRFNLFGLITSILAFISIFMPFASASAWGVTVTAALIDGADGVIVLIISLAAIVLSIFGINVVVIIAGVLNLLIDIIEVANDDTGIVTMGAGFYFLLIASIAMVAAGIVGIVFKKTGKKLPLQK